MHIQAVGRLMCAAVSPHCGKYHWKTDIWRFHDVCASNLQCSSITIIVSCFVKCLINRYETSHSWNNHNVYGKAMFGRSTRSKIDQQTYVTYHNIPVVQFSMVVTWFLANHIVSSHWSLVFVRHTFCDVCTWFPTWLLYGCFNPMFVGPKTFKFQVSSFIHPFLLFKIWWNQFCYFISATFLGCMMCIIVWFY